MLRLGFEGWFQCRFATDPDPTDEPYGLTGPTFVVPGEPPFDRIIRLQDPVAIRYPRADDFGVFVRRVTVSQGDSDAAQAIDDHPLLGARVELLDNPQFHQRNYVIVEGLRSPIDPFVISIAGNGIRLHRRDEWDVTRPGLTIRDVYLDPTLMDHRAQTIEVRSARVAEATGIMDYAAHWRQRHADLEALLKGTTDPVQRQALCRRIDVIDETRLDTGIRVGAWQFLGLLSTYRIDVNGAAAVEDPEGRLGGQVGISQVWPLEFWMGGYDVDTLCGYMRGTLTLPFYAQPPAPSSSNGT